MPISLNGGVLLPNIPGKLIKGPQGLITWPSVIKRSTNTFVRRK